MTDDASDTPGDAPAPASTFPLRRVSPATAEERLLREEGMARAIRFGATSYRDGEGKWRHIPFKEANLAPVEPWVRGPRAKRGYRRTQELRKAAGQLIGQPGDRIEIAKRLGELHWEQGSDSEGAARRGLYDAIWSREHVYDTFTVPRRYGRMLIDTGRIAAVAEEEARKIQAEDPKARGGFWVRDRNDFGLLYVVPNRDPGVEGAHADAALQRSPATEDDVVSSGEGDELVLGQADAAAGPNASFREADTLPAADAESVAEQEEAPVLRYPDIRLPRLEPTWQKPDASAADSDELPVINMGADRIKNILANEPALFDIEDYAPAIPQKPIYEMADDGYWAVWVHQDIIEYEAERQGVDPDLVKAIVYLENSRGASYGDFFERIGRSDSILPMNIKKSLWSGLVDEGADFADPIINIRGGISLIRRIQERIKNPTVAKVASIYHIAGREFVHHNGARAAEFYRDRAWQKKPPMPVYPEMDHPPDWSPHVDLYESRRKKLQQCLAQEMKRLQSEDDED